MEELKLPVPRPTRAAMELNQKEVASRREPSMLSNAVGAFTKHPDLARAARVGEPPLVDTTPVSATDVVRAATVAIGKGGSGGDGKLSVQTVDIKPGENQEPPRSDNPPRGNVPLAEAAAGRDRRPG